MGMIHALYRVSASLLIIITITAGWSCHSRDKLSKEERAAIQKIREKYAAMLGVQQDDISNIKLYRFIDEWYGTPYKYGGKTKSGIDCSDFASVLERQVFGKSIHPPAASMYEKCNSAKRKNLEEGDLVFFKIQTNKVSHVGVYLQNGRFVHASSKKGVIISNLDDTYYAKYFYKGGKVN